jgi:hypothetical protein
MAELFAAALTRLQASTHDDAQPPSAGVGPRLTAVQRGELLDDSAIWSAKQNAVFLCAQMDALILAHAAPLRTLGAASRRKQDALLLAPASAAGAGCLVGEALRASDVPGSGGLQGSGSGAGRAGCEAALARARRREVLRVPIGQLPAVLHSLPVRRRADADDTFL